MRPNIPIAIVGAACRLPGAESFRGFADLLLAGRSAVTAVPGDRWTKSRYFHPAPGQAGKTYTFAAGALSGIFDFDPAFFGISAREALSVDPQQRLILELAYEAMEDAGLLPSRLAGSATGVYMGASSWDFAATSFADAAGLDAYGMQGAALSSVSNRVSYVFGLRGPSLTVDTACSSSLVALHLAAQALYREEVGQAIVGGVNLLNAPQAFVGFARASMLSRLGLCHSFDARADGYVRGEGGGAIILKPLAAALADGDAIRAVILGTGTNSDGRTNGFSVPSGTAQAELIQQVRDSAGIAPDDFAYFEAHGTGTPVGDPIEARAIGESIGRSRSAPLPIGSVKSNIGHLEPASGMAGIMKLLVCLERNVIPPSLHFETPNPNIPFKELNLTVANKSRPLPPASAPRLLGINSFGFGGTNAHAVLGPPPAAEARCSDPADAGDIGCPLLLSARSAEALRALAVSWRDTLDAAPPIAVPALLRGAARRRDQHPHRMVATAARAEQLADRLEAWIDNGAAEGIVTGQSATGGVTFVYSGNGSQWAGMGLDAARQSPAFARFLTEVDDRLAPELGWSVTARLRCDDLPQSIRHSGIAQPLLFAIQVATVSALRATGIVPSAHIGHSAGEVAAAWASGALSLDQACHVIIQRSLLQGATHGAGGMASVSLGETAARDLIARLGLPLAIAAVNAAGAVTVAGPNAALDRLEEAARDGRTHFARLDLDYAFHSPAMDPIEGPLLAALRGLSSRRPHERLISTVTGGDVTDNKLNADYWWRNVRLPVRFADGIERLVRDGMRGFVEIGPQPVLQHYLRDALRAASASGRVTATLSRRAAGTDPIAAAAAECHVAGADMSGAGRFDGPAAVRGLPHYPFQRQRYAAQRTGEAVEVVAPIDDHPLLGFRDPASRDAWMSHISTASEPWLADHVVDGAVVLPAAAMIDMAFAAARVRYPDAAALEIQDLEISRAMVLDPGAVVDCRTTVTPDGHWRLASRPRLSAEATQPHATARIIEGLGRRPLLPVENTASNDVIDAATVYDRARSLRLEYGPAFRTVMRVYRTGPGRGVCELAADGADRATDGYLLDPALVDGSLQALLALIAGDTRLKAAGAVMPWRFGRVRLLRTGARPVRASLRVRQIGPRSILADIALTDAAGQTVAELSDCWFVAMPAPAQATADKTFRTEYVPSARQPASMRPGLAERVLSAVDVADTSQETFLLADACASAAAYESLRASTNDTALPAAMLRSPLISAALPWLHEDGLATLGPDGWHLATESDLPPAAEIWRSVLFGDAEGAAECVLLAGLGPALASNDAAGLLLSPALREQALFASPSGKAATAAVLRGLDAVASAWPRGQGIRVAVVGMPHPVLVRRIRDCVSTRGLPLRLTVLAADADGLAAARAELAHTPGAAARTWAEMQADDWHGYDLVVGLYGLSLPSQERLTPDRLLDLLAPGGLLLDAEPAPNRVASLLFGPAFALDAAASLRHPAAWCTALRDAGFAAAHPAPLDGAIWPAAMLVATAATDAPRAAHPAQGQDGLVVFAAPNDRLAAALASSQRMLHVMPIEAMREVLTAPFAAHQQLVLLLACKSTEEEDQAEALVELLADISTALQGMAPPRTAKLWLVSVGSPAESLVSAALTGLRRIAANELPGLDCRAVALDSLMPDGVAADRVLRELAEPDQEAEVVWRDGGRMVPRLRAGLPPPPPDRGPRQLEVRHPGLIGSLAWMPASPAAPGRDEVAIEVHAAALNFRDVMWAQGLLPDEALMDGFSGPYLGLECAGVVTAVGPGVDDLRPGDRVAAVAPRALATHAVTGRNGVMRLSPDMPFAAAATIPVAFMTAVYALGHLARLAEGETVLIHGGAGGVGLAAIQYALHKGATVYATAGSEPRRQALRMLGAAAVFDSRDTRFVDDVLAATDGKGVDVVLNSVSHELMKQSLRLLRPFGRFLEIGKRDLYEDTPVGIRALRHNASYFAIDVDELVAKRPAVGLRVLNEISDLLAAGELGSLPYRAFGFADVVPAFRLLQGSGHVGKVVLLPEPTPTAVAPASAFNIRPDGVYIVSGGLSGFGLETARWLAGRGARRLALISRRGPSTDGWNKAQAELEQAGADAHAFACDIADAAELQGVLEEIRHAMGPIVGVLHAAMVLDDAYLADMDASRFATVIRPKLGGALVLDKLTRTDPLDLFVLFSSITTVIGTPGQASYIAANRALESLAESRHAAGLPALAVQWGPIGDAGYLVRETRVSGMLSAMLGSSHLRAADALDALPGLLAQGRPVIGLADVAWGELRTRLPGLAGPFWSEMPARDQAGASGQSLSERLAGLSAEAAAGVVQEILAEEIARILQQPVSTIGIDQPVNEFGVDSLMAVELQTALEARIAAQIPLTVLSGGATLRVIAERLLRAMEKRQPVEAESGSVAAILRHEADAFQEHAESVSRA